MNEQELSHAFETAQPVFTCFCGTALHIPWVQSQNARNDNKYLIVSKLTYSCPMCGEEVLEQNTGKPHAAP